MYYILFKATKEGGTLGKKKPLGKSRLTSFRLTHTKLLRETREWFRMKRQRLTGIESDELPPASLVINHAIKTLHAISTDPDVRVTNVPGTLRNMDAILISALEQEVGKILTGLGIKFEVSRAADGGLDWVVYEKGDDSSGHAVRVGPEIFRRDDWQGNQDPLLVRPERDFTVC